MNSAWSVEITRLVVVIISALIVGASSQFWILSVSAHLLVYIIWILSQIKELEDWIDRGAHKSDAPDNSGIWQELVKLIYRSQKSQRVRKQQLADMASYYHAVMRALPDATVVVSNHLEIEWANKAAHKLLGIKPVKDIGQRLGNIVRIPELEQLIDKDAPKKRIEIESPLNPKSTLSIVKQEYDNNNYLIIAQDVSQRAAIRNLRKAFIANASHELRTPLTVISGYLEILLDEELSPSLLEIIKNAHEQADRMGHILSDMLTLSKLEESNYESKTGTEVDVKALLEHMVADFKVSYANTQHQFKVELADFNLRVVENDFYSVCQNLVSNAVKYSAPNSLITITWGINDEGYATLSIQDEGDGIAPEHINRITERFYRVNQIKRQVQGTGLGLSIVKHIMENFGGYLDIQSQLNVGSTFKACFPKYRIINSSPQA